MKIELEGMLTQITTKYNSSQSHIMYPREINVSVKGYGGTIDYINFITLGLSEAELGNFYEAMGGKNYQHRKWKITFESSDCEPENK